MKLSGAGDRFHRPARKKASSKSARWKKERICEAVYRLEFLVLEHLESVKIQHCSQNCDARVSASGDGDVNSPATSELCGQVSDPAADRTFGSDSTEMITPTFPQHSATVPLHGSAPGCSSSRYCASSAGNALGRSSRCLYFIRNGGKIRDTLRRAGKCGAS